MTSKKVADVDMKSDEQERLCGNTQTQPTQWEMGDGKTPPATRTCCGEVAYTVGKNTADAYLKKDGNSAAAQHFNKPKNKKNGDKKGGVLGFVRGVFG